MKKILIPTFIFLAAALPDYVLADETHTVTPLVIEREVEPRSIMAEEIKITNTGTYVLKIFPTVNAITLGSEGEIKSFETAVMTDQTQSVTSWLALSRARLELKPGESVKLPLEIKVHPQAVPGEYYAFIGFASADKRDEAERAVEQGGVPGVTVRLSIADKSSEYLRLQSFVVPRYDFGKSSDVIVYDLENIGDLPIVPAGEIIIYDIRGKEVATVPVNPERLTIASRGSKKFTAPMPDTGTFGRHKAYLNVEYGSKQRANIYDITFFTVVPLKILIALFLILLTCALALTLWYIYRTRKLQPVDDESVAMYVRTGEYSELQHHDINLKHE